MVSRGGAKLDGKTVLPGGTRLDEYHPGFAVSSSVLLHRFGTDAEYKTWRLRRVMGDVFADMSEQGGAAEMEQVREMIGLEPNPRAGLFNVFRTGSRGTSRVGGQLQFSAVATLTRRNPPPLFGVGLIDFIPAEVMRAAAMRPIPGFPEINGRLVALKDGRIGRFGWKAQTATLKEFVESACAMELGLEVPAQHQAKAPLDFTKRENGLDLIQDECDALTSFVAKLAAPIERTAPGRKKQPDIEAGRGLFASVGCTGCHMPKLGSVEGIYSDLLLHDMGADLGDSGNYYGEIESPSKEGATTTEWRTPPLWGFRDSGPYLHDGRADTLEEAVALHGGQSARSAKMFFQLKLRERLQVQSFLNSLAAPSAERGG